MRSAGLRRSLVAIARFRARLGLSVAATLAFAAGLAVLGATIVVFGGVTEDVTRHNGLLPPTRSTCDGSPNIARTTSSRWRAC
ncbi:MAG: hypothetical protein M3Q30_07385 [Actinomycetota bacterium]|nr:hypothetical protein [Actinomycetota bacterium]